MNKDRADDILKEAMNTFAQRRSVYGNSYTKHADVMKALFPDGLTIESDLDFVRFSILNMVIVKMGRYSLDFSTPHQDSIHDSIVYCAILEELDQFVGDEKGWEAWKAKEAGK